MNRLLRGVVEWINPDLLRQVRPPLLEGGLRPNDHLDDAVVVPAAPGSPTGIEFVGGDLVVSGPAGLTWIATGDVVDIGGEPGPIVGAGDRVVAAVDGRGLVAVDAGGTTEVLCDDATVRHNVSALAAGANGEIWACVASGRFALADWALALVDRDRTGSLLRVDSGRATAVATSLAWPAGCEVLDGQVYVSLSFEHRIEGRRIDDPSSSAVLGGALPGYPGAMRSRGDRLLVAVPYLRNRMTEMILADAGVTADMRASMSPDTWLVPVLAPASPVRDPLQFGQQTVMGVSKAWAPPRSYGLVIDVDTTGRVVRSWHSRHGGRCHGITAVATTPERIVVISRSADAVVEVAA